MKTKYLNKRGTGSQERRGVDLMKGRPEHDLTRMKLKIAQQKELACVNELLNLKQTRSVGNGGAYGALCLLEARG